METPAPISSIGEAGSSRNQKPMQMPAAVEGCDYEVFLSFRGPDTRTGITDYLFCRFKEAGIRTFRDNEELRVGEEISQDLLGAIEQSKISIPIFSKNYASSKWCLDELAQMVDCSKSRGQKIMPIFYHVEPSEVRYQKEGYGKALLEHENKKRFDHDKIQKWKKALKDVGELKGWKIEDKADSHEGKLVEHIVTEVLSELRKAYLEVTDLLVGVHQSVEKVLGMIGTATDDVKIVGIHGLGGVGKTTLAKVVYNELFPDFANCCFLPDVRDTSNSKGIVHLQNRLISDLSKQTHSSIHREDEGRRTIEERFSSKKVLLLLDDVNEERQLTALLGRQGRFGPGSRILITTRNASVLQAFGVKLTYSLDVMDSHRSLQLFSKHAFRRDQPPIDKLEQSRQIVNIALGLPLLLEIMGSTLALNGQSKELWDDYLEKWKKGPIEGIRSTLMVSYEALDVSQKQIFLDIACLFAGYDKDIVIYMWKDCGLSPIEGLEVLRSRSLIKIEEDNRLWMHDQLKDLGRKIVNDESGVQSRLWDHKNALQVLRSKERNEKLEALCMVFEDSSEYRFPLDRFATLPNLRFIHFDSRRLTDEVDRLYSEASLLLHNKSLITSLTNSFLATKQLLPDLRWFSWHNFPRRIIEISNFSFSNLVILDLSRSKITHDWSGWRHVKKAEKLKVLNLSECEHLIRTPDFSGFKLERLILEKCTRLAKIHKSIGELKSLVFLNLNFCSELRILPKELGELPALTELLLDGTSVREIPNCRGMGKLKMLSLDATQLTALPDSTGALTNLESLSLNWCSNMGRLPHSVLELRSLIKLELLETGLTEFPDSLESLKNLKELKLSWSYGSRGISALPLLPVSLTSVAISSPSLITVPDLSNLIDLKTLFLSMGVVDISSESALLQDPMPWIGRLSKLEVLTLTIRHMTNLSPGLQDLPRLKSLHLYGCLALKCIPRIPLSISKLHVVDCPRLTTIDLSNLANLLELYVLATPLEDDLPGWEQLHNLQEWKISADFMPELQAYLRPKMLEQHGLTKNMLGLRRSNY